METDVTAPGGRSRQNEEPRDGRWRGADPDPVPDGMETMSRAEVAELWGVDPRVVTRYVGRGVLRKYVTERDALGRPGRVVFDAAEARRIAVLRRGDAAPGPAPVEAPRKRW